MILISDIEKATKKTNEIYDIILKVEKEVEQLVNVTNTFKGEDALTLKSILKLFQQVNENMILNSDKLEWCTARLKKLAKKGKTQCIVPIVKNKF